MSASASAAVEPVALGRAHAVHVVDVAGLVLRQLDEPAEPSSAYRAAASRRRRVPLVEVRQEDAQQRRLHRVEPRVVADVQRTPSSPREPWKRSMRSRSASSASLTAIRPPSPSANRFFVGKKLNVETMLVAMPAAPNACAASSTTGSPSSLQLGDRRRPAEQVHGHDRLRPLRDAALDVGRVEVERDGIDVGEDRRRAAPRDRLGGRVERERRADHLVARADPERVEHEHERVGAVRDADRTRRRRDSSAASRSNASTSGPKMKRPDSSVRANASFSSGMSGAYCALTSTWGIVTTARS